MTAYGTIKFAGRDGIELVLNGSDLVFHLSYVERDDFVFHGQCKTPELADRYSLTIGPFKYPFSITVHTNQYGNGKYKCGFEYSFGFCLTKLENKLEFKFDRWHPEVRYE